MRIKSGLYRNKKEHDIIEIKIIKVIDELVFYDILSYDNFKTYFDNKKNFFKKYKKILSNICENSIGLKLKQIIE